MPEFLVFYLLCTKRPTLSSLMVKSKTFTLFLLPEIFCFVNYSKSSIFTPQLFSATSPYSIRGAVIALRSIGGKQK